jgi:hypothetical protein
MNIRAFLSLCYLAPLAFLISGCLFSKKATTYVDTFDSIKVDQMMANNISAAPFQKTIVCLNARRETRRVGTLTNVSVTLVTNSTIYYVTNLTITSITNQSRTLSTNAQAQPAPLKTEGTNETAGATGETNTVVTLAQAIPPNSTNDTVTTANNVTISKSPSQLASTANFQLLQNRQITINNTNGSIMTADNQTVSVETNAVVNAVTNLSLVLTTNFNVIYTNQMARDYYIYSEFTPPQDFTLASGESLVLLVDGTRWGLTPTNSQTLFLARKGYQATLYRVSPELLTDIANARQVKVRLKGNNSVIEKDMNTGSRSQFRKFLLHYFAPEGNTGQATAAEINNKNLALQ